MVNFFSLWSLVRFNCARNSFEHRQLSIGLTWMLAAEPNEGIFALSCGCILFELILFQSSDSAAMFPGRYPTAPDNMWTFWNPQAMGLQGQFCGGDLMNQQSQAQLQAQTQAQLAALREQNNILNQQLGVQAQTHIQHLQQLLPFHQCTFHPHPSQPTASAPDPPTPVAPQSTPPASSASFNAEEMMQQMKNTVESSIQAFVGQDPRAQHEPTSCSGSTTNSSCSTYSKSSSYTGWNSTTATTPFTSLSISLPSAPWGAWQTSNLYSTKSSSCHTTETNTSLLSTKVVTQKTTFHFERSIKTSKSSLLCQSAISLSTSTRSTTRQQWLLSWGTHPRTSYTSSSTVGTPTISSGSITPQRVLPEWVPIVWPAIHQQVEILEPMEGLFTVQTSYPSIGLDWLSQDFLQTSTLLWLLPQAVQQTSHCIFLRPSTP